MNILSINSGFLTRCCPAVMTDGRKDSGWRHFVFSCILPVLLPCPFVNSDVQSLSARRSNQHLVTFKMTIWVSVKSATSLCLTATHSLQTGTKNKERQSESTNLHAVWKTDCITSLRWLWDWGHSFSFIPSGNLKLRYKMKTVFGRLLDSVTKCQFHLVANICHGWSSM